MRPQYGAQQRATNCKKPGVKGNKICLTYVFISNADGSQKLPPFIIRKTAHPHAFNKKWGLQLGLFYWNNAKAWMTADPYKEWIEQWDCELQRKKQKILLLQDNFSGHIIPPGLQCIHVENFEPNLTAHVQ